MLPSYHGFFNGARWFSGRPPRPGWYQASIVGGYRTNIWRWWNGLHWSEPVAADTDAAQAAEIALLPAELEAAQIVWTLYWPEGAPPRMMDEGDEL